MRALLLVPLASLLLGAGVAPSSGGGSSYTPTASDHAGQAMTADSLTTSNATNGVILTDGSRLCLNGATCTQTLRNNASNATFSGGVVAGSINSSGSVGFVSYISGATTGSVPACSSGTVNRIYIFSGTPARLCLCTDLSGGNYQWVNLLDPSDLTGTAATCPTR